MEYQRTLNLFTINIVLEFKFVLSLQKSELQIYPKINLTHSQAYEINTSNNNSTKLNAQSEKFCKQD